MADFKTDLFARYYGEILFIGLHAIHRRGHFQPSQPEHVAVCQVCGAGRSDSYAECMCDPSVVLMKCAA